mmetsp:Transcript_95161/g.217907  ORF Transcript_95161/g.217907 Transcript_95161/m.217907 type:complete len:451 (+) Transcript_95161:31-1383(+)
MRWWALGCVVAGGAGFDRSPHVVDLSPANFADLVENQETHHSYIMFHVNWCEHCKASLPEFHQAATMTADHYASAESIPGLPPRYFTMDCSEHSSNLQVGTVCKKYAETKFPSLIMVRGKRHFQFDRPRMSQVIAWWGLRMSRPPVMHMLDAKGLKEQINAAEELTFVLCADASEEFIQEWPQVAEQFMDKYSFLLLSDKPGCDKLRKNTGMTGSPLLVADPGSHSISPVPYAGKLTEKRAVRWVNLHRWSRVIPLNNYSVGEVLAVELPTVVVTYNSENTPEAEEATRVAEALADERRECIAREDCFTSQKGGVLLASVDLADEGNVDMLGTHFTLASDPFPRVFVAVTKEREHHVYWENHQRLNLQNAKLDRAFDLMKDDSSMQYSGPMMSKALWSFNVRQGKKVVRFASRSVGHLVGVVAATLGLAAACFFSCKGICADEEEDRKDK